MAALGCFDMMRKIRTTEASWKTFSVPKTLTHLALGLGHSKHTIASNSWGSGAGHGSGLVKVQEEGTPEEQVVLGPGRSRPRGTLK